MTTVTWRKVVAALVATVLGLSALVVVFQSDGLPAVDAVSSRATRWFVHQPTGRVVLVDGYGGRALASLDVDALGADLRVVEGGPGAYVVNDSTGEVRAIDSAELRLGPAQGLATLTTGRAIAGVGSSGLVVVNPGDGKATLLPATGESIGFDVDVGESPLVAPDGSVWSLNRGAVTRTTSGGASTTALTVGSASSLALSLVGNRPMVVDRSGRRARLGTGQWQQLPTIADPSEIIVQQPGPANSCGWVGADDDLWCISDNGIEEVANITGLGIDGSDLLAIAGDAAALVRRGPTAIARFDWRTESLLPDFVASVSGAAIPAVTSTVDLVWVDDVAGQFVWAINPWGIEAINKNDGKTLVLGEDGELVNEGDGNSESGSRDDGAAAELEEREPDDNGIDDPPVAVDDPVTSRSGRSVPVPVTANDYDPDGEAIAVVSVGNAGHGNIEIGTASTVIYTPDPGYVGLDQFTYTIADGDGTEASADVIVELIPLDATNQPPVGSPDEAETGAGVPVIVDVLLNDIDPERDPLQLGSFSFDGLSDGVGEVTETVGPSGLAALRFEPSDGFEGSAVFSYRPVDSFGALGDDVDVRIEVASIDDDNRPPIVRPDSVRLRRGIETVLPVLVNDEDPDGDLLTLGVVEPLPEGLSVVVQGEQLAVLVTAGSADSIPFEYLVDDGNGHVVNGAVLVDVIPDSEPNRPPVLIADSDTAVVGSTIEIDVLANDSDPDGDPLVVVDVTQPGGDRGHAIVLAPNKVQFTPTELDDEDDAIARFTYSVDDGNGHVVTGDITITVLPEALPAPPYAQDDSTFTFVDQPVTIDVLRNDGDPSGERPRLVGTPGCPSGGTAVVTADSQVRYVPPLRRSGAFRCTYEVTNSQGLRASASIIVSVREPLITNEPPNAVLDQLIVETDSINSVDVTLNDDDPDGDNNKLEVVSSTAPSIGTATRVGNRLTYTAGSFTGVTNITYGVVDEEGAQSVGQVSIRIIEPVNDPPTANGDVQIITGPGVPTSFAVLSNDFDPNEDASALSVEGVELISGDGAVSSSGSIVTINPNPDFVGDVVATYTVRDSGGLTSSALVTLVVQQQPNRPPLLNDDSNEVNNGGSVTTSVLFNDSDPDGDALSLSITGGPDPSLGTASANGGAITFIAQPGAAGLAVVQYAASDGEFSESAALRITVHPCSESFPTANDAFLNTGYQQPIAVNLAAYSANGIPSITSSPGTYDGNVYTPPAGENGNVTINYSVTNSCRQRADGQITIDVNRDPMPQPVSISMGRSQRQEFPVATIAGDDEALTITGNTGAPAWVTTEAALVVVAPPLGTAIGTYTWTATVTDPGGLSAAVPFSVTIVNATPVAKSDAVDVSGGAASFEITANDVDPDDDNGALQLQSVPSTLTFQNGEVGTIAIVGAGQRRVSIDPLAGLGQATFSYTVVDPDGAVSGVATVVVTGAAFNHPPTATDQTVDVDAGVATTFVLTASDPDSDPLNVVNIVDPDGIVTSVSGLSVTVTTPSDGSFSFTYQVSDGPELSGVATVTVGATTPTTTTTTTTTTTSTTTTSTVPDTTTTTTTTSSTTTTTSSTTTTTTTTVP